MKDFAKSLIKYTPAITAVLVFFSGINNILSVALPAVPWRMQHLLVYLPLQFIQLSDFLTLLIGILLCLTAANIYKKKRSALTLAVALLFFSIIFHLTKSIDYEDALVSFVLFAILLATGDIYTVKSSRPRLISAVKSVVIFLALVLFYGVIGFWFLDKRQFGIRFNIFSSIKYTISELLFIPIKLVPHTRRARWFIESLQLLSISGIAYMLGSLFRPAVYTLVQSEIDKEEARTLVNKYGCNQLDYYKVWPGKLYFFSSTRKSFISYGVTLSFAIVLGDPLGPDEDIPLVVKEFVEFCTGNDWWFAFLSASKKYAEVFENAGLKLLKVGDEALIDLTNFDLEGFKGKDFRYALNKFENEGYRTEYIEPPLSIELVKKLRIVSDSWLSIKGRRERVFTLGAFEENYVRTTPVFVVFDRNNKPASFINIVSAYKEGQTTADLMRRMKDAPNGLNDYLFTKLFIEMKNRGFKEFSLGLAPMSKFKKEENPTFEEKALRQFMLHLKFIFSYGGLEDFKSKYTDYWVPRFIVIKSTTNLPKLGLALNKLFEYKK